MDDATLPAFLYALRSDDAVRFHHLIPEVKMLRLALFPHTSSPKKVPRHVDKRGRDLWKLVQGPA